MVGGRLFGSGCNPTTTHLRLLEVYRWETITPAYFLFVCQPGIGELKTETAHDAWTVAAGALEKAAKTSIPLEGDPRAGVARLSLAIAVGDRTHDGPYQSRTLINAIGPHRYKITDIVIYLPVGVFSVANPLKSHRTRKSEMRPARQPKLIGVTEG
jgi:hypothetical protein